MPQYMLLICNPTEGLSPDEAQAEHPKWMAYTQALSEAGALVSGEALQPVATATTVRVRGDERLVSDGPFAETPEELTGFRVVEADGPDEAVAAARGLGGAAVEVRPEYAS